MQTRASLRDVGWTGPESPSGPPTGVRPGPPRPVPVRVLLVDDHVVVRRGLRLLLGREPEIEVVGEAGSLGEALAEASRVGPDVIVLDLVLSEECGIEGIPRLRAAAPRASVLVLSMQDDPRYVRESIAAGAAGYLPKEAADVEVVQAVREVAAGGRYLYPPLGVRLIAAEARAKAAGEADRLTPREREVARLLACGHTNEEAADLLGISVRTVESHRRRMMRKLRLVTRAELVRFAIEHRLLGDDDREQQPCGPEGEARPRAAGLAHGGAFPAGQSSHVRCR